MDTVLRGKDIITNIQVVEHCVLAKEFPPQSLLSGSVPVLESLIKDLQERYKVIMFHLKKHSHYISVF